MGRADAVAGHRGEDVEARLGVDLGGVALAERPVEGDVVVHVGRGDGHVVEVLAPAPRAEKLCGRFWKSRSAFSGGAS